MASKKAKRKNNVTRKKFTGKVIPITITTVYNKLYSSFDNEKPRAESAKFEEKIKEEKAKSEEKTKK